MNPIQSDIRKPDILLHILRVISTGSAKAMTITAAALGIAALIPGSHLPPELGIIAQSIGIEAMGSLLERMAHGEHVSDDDIKRIVEGAITESGIDKLLTRDQFFHGFAHLREGQRLISDQLEVIYKSVHQFSLTQRESLFEIEGIPLGNSFSNQIKQQMAYFNKVIDTLTNDQFRIIQWLRGQRRAAISGCAGSGKTLVAVEKAVRLDKAGFRTLILCHNPYLAKYLRELTSNTGVHVYDFMAWLNKISSNFSTIGETWTHYEEPTNTDLGIAFELLYASNKKYDAIIVDEGQDFRETWWILIETALEKPETGILYIFFDDNQALLPRQSNYPVDEAPFNLSKNCRNSGKVFEFVRKFHQQAPETSILLSELGILRHFYFEPGAEPIAIKQAVNTALRYMRSDQLIVVTTEPDPVDKSILYMLETDLAWQNIVYSDLEIIAQASGLKNKSHQHGTSISNEIPKLSDNAYPVPEDIKAVQTFVGRSSSSLYSLMQLRKRLASPNDKYQYRERPCGDPIELIMYYSSDHWGETIDYGNERIRIGENLPLYSISEIKGLEADGVILFILSSKQNLEANFYVGSSRARFALYIVCNTRSLTQLPKLSPRRISRWKPSGLSDEHRNK